jgi:hypothetical protein
MINENINSQLKSISPNFSDEKLFFNKATKEAHVIIIL